jgi:acyl-CoA thioester hydrolase
VRPALYGQKLEVRTRLLEYENRLKIGYEIVDLASGTRLTKGYTTQVAVNAATQELQFVSPPVVFEKLERVWAR